MSQKTNVLIGVLAGVVVLFFVLFVGLFAVVLPRQRVRSTNSRMAALAASAEAVVSAYAAETGDEPPYDINAIRTRYSEYLVKHRVTTVDAWNKQIKITLKQTGGYELISAGPDRTMFTADDLTMSKD